MPFRRFDPLRVSPLRANVPVMPVLFRNRRCFHDAPTNLLTLRVTDANPRTAFLVTKAIVENHQVVSYQVMGDLVLEVLQEPKVPTAHPSP